MKRYSIPILLAILVLASGVLLGCRQKGDTPASQTPASQIFASEILEFAGAILLVEKDRDDLMVEHQDFNEKLMDMPTATVFQKTDDFVKRSGKLKEMIVNMEVPGADSATFVHTTFMLAYAAEYKAYFEWSTAVLSADLNKLNDAIKLFYQADALFEEAYEAMDKMLEEFGLKWQNIK